MARHEYIPLRDTGGETPPPPRRGSGITPLLAAYSVIVTLILVGSAIFGYPLSSKCGDEEPRQAPMLSDFKTALRYKTVWPPEDAWHLDLYSGDPSPRVEKAWHQLLHGMKHGYGVKISTSEADELGFTDYYLQSDGRVLSAPAVFHALHCLRRIRQNLYGDRYYPNATEEQMEDNRHHSAHCLETIRASLICNPDLTLLRVTEVVGDKEPFKAAVAPVQKCVDWDSLVEIVDSRTT